MKQYKFQEGDIVYWCHQKGHEYSIKWGRVDVQYFDRVYVDYLHPKENRRINGIPIDEFEDNKYKKLPKGWNYDTRLFEITYDNLDDCTINLKMPETIKLAYDKGSLVKDSEIFHGTIEEEITKNGYRIIMKYSPWFGHISYITIQPHRLYRTYEEAEKEVLANRAEFERQANLSYYDWSVEQIDETLNRWQGIYNHSDKLKNRYREWLLDLDNVEDVETRVFGGEIQWKYWKNKKWANIEL